MVGDDRGGLLHDRHLHGGLDRALWRGAGQCAAHPEWCGHDSLAAGGGGRGCHGKRCEHGHEVPLAGEGADLLASHGTDDPEAYRLYLKGREFTVGTMREMDKAIDLFKEAIDREPGYALAWAGLAQSYTHQCFLQKTTC